MRRWVRLVAVIGMLVGMLTVAAVPARAADVYYDVWVSDSYPSQFGSVTVYLQLCNDYNCYSPRVGVHVNSTWNYRTTTSYQDGYTDGRGVAAITRYISGATPGYSVQVNLSYVNSFGVWQTVPESAYFTPGGGASSGSSGYSPPSYSAPSYSQPPPPTSTGDYQGRDGR